MPSLTLVLISQCTGKKPSTAPPWMLQSNGMVNHMIYPEDGSRCPEIHGFISGRLPFSFDLYHHVEIVSILPVCIQCVTSWRFHIIMIWCNYPSQYLFPLLFGGKNIGVRKKVGHFYTHTAVHTWNALVFTYAAMTHLSSRKNKQLLEIKIIKKS